MKKNVVFFVIMLITLAVAPVMASDGFFGMKEGSFKPEAPAVQFNFGDLDANNVYDAGDGFTISFGGYFQGGLGTPTQGSPLTIDYNSPKPFIVNDRSNPDSPVLSGSPLFDGPIAVLFCEDVAAVGLTGGFFDTIGSTSIAAYDRDGNLLDTVVNSQRGIEFFGIGSTTGERAIAGIQFYITGDEPAGYAIDNLTYALDLSQYDVPGAVPEPSTFVLMGFGVAALAAKFARRKRGATKDK